MKFTGQSYLWATNQPTQTETGGKFTKLIPYSIEKITDKVNDTFDFDS